MDIFEEQCGEDSEDPRIHLNDTRAQMEYPFAICWAVDQCGTGDLPGRFLSSNPGESMTGTAIFTQRGNVHMSKPFIATRQA